MWLITLSLATIVVLGDTAPTEPTYDTIIVGLGASGCAAASVLCKAGKKVLALEAQNRIGGRVHTVLFGNGIVELGAEWIHGEVNNRVYELALENNITILSQRSGFDVYRSDGSHYNSDIVNDLVEYTITKFEQPPKDPEPLGQYLTRELMAYMRSNHSELLNDQDFISEFLYFMDPVVNSFEASNNWNDISTHGKAENLEGDMSKSWHKYGYNTLFEILLNSYHNGAGLPSLELKLEKVVSKISYPSDPKADVEVTCKDGSTYRARNVIVTVSLGVLKETHDKLFSPLLPKNKVESFDHISFGVVGKIFLNFDHVWWEPNQNDYALIWKAEDKKQVAQEDWWITKLIGPTFTMGSNTTVTLWSTGDVTKIVESLPEDLLKRKSMELIRRFLGKNITIPEPTGVLRTKWFSNPYTRGTYSFDNVQAPLHPDARAILAEPLKDSNGAPRVLFAGEATNSIHYGTVHGAIETGYREANRLLSKNTP